MRLGWWFAGLLFGGCLTAGCQDPAYVAAQTVRYERIESVGETYAVREADRPERIRALGELAETLENGRAEHLQATLQLIEDAHAQDCRDWRANAPVRRRWMHRIFDGQPGCIPDVWRTMTY